jgi:GTP-binding protein Era
MNNASSQKCGFVAVLGLPNAGKSTLVNALVGSKVSIVSKRVQTTRCRVMGIAIQENAQVVLIDTPGVFTPQKTLEKAMVRAAWDALEQANVIIHIVDAGIKSAAHKNDEIISRLPKDAQVLLVLNKVDSVSKPDLLALAQTLNEKYSYVATFMISALKSQGTKDVLADIAQRLPDAPWMFEEDQITDMPMRLLAAEITREKIFQQLYQELPYAVLVETEKWENFRDGSVKIDQAIYVQRDTQKAIVLGKGGSQIRKIGEAARVDLENIMGNPVHLKLFVKVQEDWPEKPENYALMGLDFSR